MAAKKISAQQWVDELNRAYEKTEGYDPGNRFVPSPRGAVGNGVKGTIGGAGTQSVWTQGHSTANQRVSEEFEIDWTMD